MFTSVALARELEDFLNQGYPLAALTGWRTQYDRMMHDPEIHFAWNRVMRMLGDSTLPPRSQAQDREGVSK
jgi:hypothetical protein